MLRFQKIQPRRPHVSALARANLDGLARASENIVRNAIRHSSVGGGFCAALCRVRWRGGAGRRLGVVGGDVLLEP